MELVLSLGLGVGLAAACGFRVFVPLLVMSVASAAGHLDLASGFEWIASPAAIIVFSVATVIEVLAYYLPWVDNALDLAAWPAAVIAGTVATASAVADVSPLMQWTLAVVAGGTAAAAVQTATTALRQLSSLATFGAGNPIVSTGESFGAVALAVVAVLAPLVAVGSVVALLAVALWLLTSAGRSRGARVSQPS